MNFQPGVDTVGAMTATPHRVAPRASGATTMLLTISVGECSATPSATKISGTSPDGSKVVSGPVG